MRMRSVVPLLPLAAAGVMCAQDFVVQSERVSLTYDDRMSLRLRWLGDNGRSVISFDPTAQDGIEVNGWNCFEFELDRPHSRVARVSASEFGPALQAEISGLCKDDEHSIAIERSVRILLPDRFKDAAVMEQSYRNLGTRAVRVGTVYNQRLVLDRGLAEPEQHAYALASFQGGAYHWGREYAIIRLEPGFVQSNFQGLDDRTGPEGEGGGMPFIDLWAPGMGVAISHLEKVPKWVSLPVEVRTDGRVEMGLTEKPQAKLGQKEWLAPGEEYHPISSAIVFHHGDYFDALRTYGDLLRARGIAIPRTSPSEAYEPYWKSWGFDVNFTQKQILDVLPELESLGIHIANLDDGWFDFYGDWDLNRAPGKFPGGEPDIKNFVQAIHARGFKTRLWWYPFGVSPESRLMKAHADLVVMDERGGYPMDDRKQYQLCPAYAPARQHIVDSLRRFIRDWDFDSVYVDGGGLTAVPPCFNPAHKHASPLDSFESTPKVFEDIDVNLKKLKPASALEVCICGLPHSPYYMPFYDLDSASDPVSPLQMRRRIKVHKAIRGPEAAVGDCYQVPIQEWKSSSLPESFESAFGTGAQLTTFYRRLTPEQGIRWRRWFALYRELGLSRGEYVNLYDLAFDVPEIHVVRKNRDLFYGIFADYWGQDRPIELRGLDPGQSYDVYDYAAERSLGTLSGKSPFLRISFKDSLLLRVRPSHR
jgi:alpha-galactosidase